MGPPAGTPLPVDPSLDNLRSTADQVSPTFFGSGVPQGETTSIFRAPQVSVGQWTTYPNQITDIHNLPPDPVDRYAVTNGPQDVWSPYRSNGPPANAPSQIPSKRRQIPHSDSGYETRSLATGSVHSTQLVEDPRAQQNLPSSRSITQPYVNSQGEQHLSSSRNRIQQYAIPYETMYANGGQQTLDFTIVAEALQQTETIQCDHSGCTWTGKCPSELKYVLSLRIVVLESALTLNIENIKLVTKGSLGAMNLAATEKMASRPSMISTDIRNAFTI